MISGQFLWSMILSLVMIVRIITTLLTERTIPFFAYTLDYLKNVGLVGALLCIIEYTAFEHWVKLIRKRVPENDHDFLAGWLQIVNVVLSMYFAYIQRYDTWSTDVPIMRY